MPHTLTAGSDKIFAEAHEHFAEEMYSRMSVNALRTMRAVAPEDTGELIAGLHYEDETSTEGTIVGEAEHTEGVLRGTGIYGPSGKPITPTNSSMLVFYWDKVGSFVAFKGDLETPQQMAMFANWAEDRGMVPFFSWPKGMPPRNFAQWTVDVEMPRLDGYAREAARETSRVFS